MRPRRRWISLAREKPGSMYSTSWNALIALWWRVWEGGLKIDKREIENINKRRHTIRVDCWTRLRFESKSAWAKYRLQLKQKLFFFKCSFWVRRKQSEDVALCLCSSESRGFVSHLFRPALYELLFCLCVWVIRNVAVYWICLSKKQIERFRLQPSRTIAPDLLTLASGCFFIYPGGLKDAWFFLVIQPPLVVGLPWKQHRTFFFF